MTLKLMTQPWRWKQGASPAHAAYVGAMDEMTVDFTSNVNKLCIHNATTPGGEPIEPTIITGIAIPEITHPVTGAVGIVSTPTITSSLFVGITQAYESEVQSAAYWEFSTDPAFGTVDHASGRTTTYLSEYNLAAAGVSLLGSTTYYVRCAHEGVSGVVSPFGPVSYFSVEPDNITGVSSTVTASTPVADAGYGGASVISADSTVIAVGAPGDSTAGSFAGAVYVYRLTNGVYVEEAKLVSSTPVASGLFGNALSISDNGTVIVVGSSGDAPTGLLTNSGKAYVFLNNGGGWSEETQLTALDHANYDGYGHSVDVSGDGSTVTVGAPMKDSGTLADAGAVFTYTRDSLSQWAQSSKITAVTPSASAFFGWDVATDSTASTMVIGVQGDSTRGTYSGTAYLFSNVAGAWTELVELTSTDVSIYDYYGCSVTMSGDGKRVVVGAKGEDSIVSNAGSVFVYDLTASGWAFSAKLGSTVKATGDLYGHAVDLSSDGATLLIGAMGVDGSAVDTGAVYVMSNVAGVWTESIKVTVASALTLDYLGTSVSSNWDGSRGIAGADGVDAAGNLSGTAYVLG